MASIEIRSGSASGLICKFKIYIDGKYIQDIKQYSSIIIELEEGKHQLEIKDTGAFLKSKAFPFEVKEWNANKYIFIQHELVSYTIEIKEEKIEEKSNKIDEDVLIEDNRELKEIINSSILKDEQVKIAIKGSFREYLICTDKKVYIIKKGSVTGHFLGNGNFSIIYSQITNIEIDFHWLSGYFEISTGGLENKRLNYWSNDPNYDPAKQPNCISLNKSCKDKFEKAQKFIMDNIEKLNNMPIDTSHIKQEKSIPEQIRQYKELLDDGIITQEEFEIKKKELLNI